MTWYDDDLYDGATEPLWYGERKVWSVTGFVLGSRSRIADIPTLWVEGELSELKVPQQGATAYFTLKDPNNGWLVNATIPKQRLAALKLNLTDGDLVQCFGRPDIYARRGSFQLRVQSVEHAGRGLLLQQLEALASKLEAEGLFDADRKQPLPFLPRRIGVITGAAAAAQGDFLRNVYERFPPAKLVMVETLVQGDRAANQIIAALRLLERIDDVDVIVITRGGGAFEDFLPFSDEHLCRAIAACPTPVVSAIGHEKDSPISDLVADLRVSTPTAAARTVVPDFAEVSGGLERAQRTITRRAHDHIARRAERVQLLAARLSDRSPARFVHERTRWIDALRERALLRLTTRVDDAVMRNDRELRDMRRVLRVRLSERDAKLRAAHGHLRALSPRAVVARGYAIARDAASGRVIRLTADAPVGTSVTIDIADGTLCAAVTDTIPEATP